MPTTLDIPTLFESIAAALRRERAALNQADVANHNHGDHMVEIFEVAVGAASEAGEASLGEAMQRASGRLHALPDNGSALVYARGLSLLGEQLAARGITLDELVSYTSAHLRPEEADGEPDGKERSGEILKAMLSALADWERAEAGQEVKDGLDMGYLFGMGMAYLQAKQQGGDRLHTLAETVVSASPLGRVPHRRQSGMLVVVSLLQALGDVPAGGAG